jgi:hypothetical protein
MAEQLQIVMDGTKGSLRMLLVACTRLGHDTGSLWKLQQGAAQGRPPRFGSEAFRWSNRWHASSVGQRWLSDDSPDGRRVNLVESKDGSNQFDGPKKRGIFEV